MERRDIETTMELLLGVSVKRDRRVVKVYMKEMRRKYEKERRRRKRKEKEIKALQQTVREWAPLVKYAKEVRRLTNELFQTTTIPVGA